MKNPRSMVLFFSLFTIFSCETPDYFAEYTGADGNPVNLIANFQWPSAAEPELNRNTYKNSILEGGEIMPIEDPNSWDIIYTSEDVDYDYMTFSYAGDVSGSSEGEAGPANGSPVFSLEIENLVPDEMFEDITWTDYWNPESGTIAGTDYWWNVDKLNFIFDRAQSIKYDIRHLQYGFKDLQDPHTKPNSARYAVVVDIETDFFKLYSPETKWDIIESYYKNLLYLDDFDLLPNSYISIGTIENSEQQALNKGSMSGMRAARTDISYNLTMFLSYYEEDRPPLISGAYRFSIWIKTDPAAASEHSFDAENMTLGIRAPATGKQHFGAFNSSDIDEANQPIYPSGWTDWTKISITTPLEEVMQTSAREASDYPVIELSVSPTYLQRQLGNESVTPCRILISSPSLEFLPDLE